MRFANPFAVAVTALKSEPRMDIGAFTEEEKGKRKEQDEEAVKAAASAVAAQDKDANAKQDKL